MEFQCTEDHVLYLYPYYSLENKEDEKSKEVYHVFKKGWNLDKYYKGIFEDISDALEQYLDQNDISRSNVVITLMPSHLKGQYGSSLLKMASDLSESFGCINQSRLIKRVEDKQKSTEGGERRVYAHLQTLNVKSDEIQNKEATYVVLDDITTSGSSLEAAKRSLMKAGIPDSKVIKIAISKTMYDI